MCMPPLPGQNAVQVDLQLSRKTFASPAGMETAEILLPSLEMRLAGTEQPAPHRSLLLLLHIAPPWSPQARLAQARPCAAGWQLQLCCAGLCRKGGHFFSKHARADPFLQPDRPYFLAVEDPKDPTNDLCKGSYQILKVRSAFEYAYQQLGAPAKRSESILQRIIRCVPSIYGRDCTGKQLCNGRCKHAHPRSVAACAAPCNLSCTSPCLDRLSIFGECEQA